MLSFESKWMYSGLFVMFGCVFTICYIITEVLYILHVL